VSLASKRPRRSDYEEMRDLTEAYLRKVRRTLEAERCDHAGALQNSLQRYFTSDQFTRDYSEAIPRTSVLAFIMHAAEVAVTQRLEDKEEPKKAEMASQTIPNSEPSQPTLPDPVPEPSREPVKETPVREVVVQVSAVLSPVQTAQPEPDMPREVESVPKTKTIFKTEPGRKSSEGNRFGKPPRKTNKVISPGLGKAPPKPVAPAPVTVPPPPYYPPMPEYLCDLCGEKFWGQEQLADHKYELHPPNDTQNYDSANAISCPIFGCDEHFEDNSDLLLHMRTVHST